MNFYNVVKWVVSVVVLVIIALGAVSAPDQPSSNKPVVPNQQSQSKFNF